MATIERAPILLFPIDVLGWSLTRPGRSVVHPILGTDESDVTARAPGLRTGTLRTLWATHTDALYASQRFAVVGGAWSIAVPERPGLSMTAQITGAITEAALNDTGGGWAVDIEVQEVTP